MVSFHLLMQPFALVLYQVNLYQCSVSDYNIIVFHFFSVCTLSKLWYPKLLIRWTEKLPQHYL